MDDAGELRFVFKLDGQNISIAAHGYDCILKELLLAGVVKDIKDFVLDSALSTAQVMTNLLQFNACRILNRSVFVNGVV